MESLNSAVSTGNQNLHIPTLSQEVGELFSFFIACQKPAVILEFGSGIGASVVWALRSNLNPSWDQFILTERRQDCCLAFEQIPWPPSIKDTITFLAGEWSVDAITHALSGRKVDFFLVDGQKNQYLEVINEIYPLLSDRGFIMIDNANWENAQKVKSKSVQLALHAMHQHLLSDQRFIYQFLPSVGDGLSLLLKR